MDDPANAGPLTALIAEADHDPTSRWALGAGRWSMSWSRSAAL